MLKSVLVSCRTIVIAGVRNYARSGRTIRKRGNVADVGIDQQVEALNEIGVDNENIDMEMLEESESDFHDVGGVYKEYMKENRQHADLTRLRIVTQKYFEPVLPNLLTWSEKEQIRYLNENFPNEWTTEKLSESFPASPKIIKKILNYSWKPASEKRIQRHDASVIRNWRELQEGTLEGISPDFRKHLLKFTNRKIPPRISTPENKTEQPKEVGEFESIVLGEKREQPVANDNNSEQLIRSKEHVVFEQDEATSFRKTTQNRKHAKDAYVTLSELQNKIDHKIKTGGDIAEEDKYFLNVLDKKNTTETVPNVPQSVLAKFPAETTISTAKKDGSLKTISHKPLEVQTYPDRIRIPKSAYIKDHTYKVKDCYYDHDGQFLYRVPGMTS